jgi:uncharacterized protein (DUF1697 family)
MDKIVYLVLLRGINVGGNNIVKMDELKKLFEGMDFSAVMTYIQSGNIVFMDSEADKTKLIEKIESALFKRLNNSVKVSLLTLHEVQEIITKKPKGFGENAEEYKYDAVFLIRPLTAKDALRYFETKNGVDAICVGKNVLYFQRLKKDYRKSYFSKIAGTAIYKNITIRNWNTTKKMYELMEKITISLHGV